MHPNHQPSPQQNIGHNTSTLNANIPFSPIISPINPLSTYNEPMSNRLLSPSSTLISPFSNQSNPYNYSPPKINPNPHTRPTADMLISSQLKRENINRETYKIKEEIKDKNINEIISFDKVSLSKATFIGQEVVQEIVHKSSEVFQCLKALQIPLAANPKFMSLNNEKVKKCQDALKEVVIMIEKLHTIYKKCHSTQPIVKDQLEKKLLGLAYGPNSKLEILPSQKSETQLQHEDLVKKLRMKNEELYILMNEMRTIIWEVNSMLSLKNDKQI